MPAARTELMAEKARRREKWSFMVFLFLLFGIVVIVNGSFNWKCCQEMKAFISGSGGDGA